MLKTTISFLRTHLGRVVDQVAQRGDRIVIQRHGRPVAAIVRYSDYQALEEAGHFAADFIKWKQTENLKAHEALQDALARKERNLAAKPRDEGDGMVVQDPYRAR
ncbi:MAG: type II toxin-antitoxin system Phd/YefM family antitoxin [Pseudomonadota bacterium]